MKNVTKIVMVCSAGSRTGGPEASFQLVHELNAVGLSAEIWLVTPTQVAAMEASMSRGERIGDRPELLTSEENQFDEYARYQHTVFDGQFDSQTTFILAEKYLHLVPYLLNARPMIWWLSVDNAFQALAKINLNFLRLPQVRHIHQCEYAQQVLQSLGISSQPVFDYTVIDDTARSIPLPDRRMKVALTAGRKVIFPLKQFAQKLCSIEPNLEVVLLQGLSREAVYEALSTARLFYDMGNFPGNDRMYREALLFGTPVMTLDVAGATGGALAQLPSFYRPTLSQATSSPTIQKMLHILHHPSLHDAQYEDLRRVVGRERETFSRQVIQAFVGG